MPRKKSTPGANDPAATAPRDSADLLRLGDELYAQVKERTRICHYSRLKQLSGFPLTELIQTGYRRSLVQARMMAAKGISVHSPAGLWLTNIDFALHELERREARQRGRARPAKAIPIDGIRDGRDLLGDSAEEQARIDEAIRRLEAGDQELLYGRFADGLSWDKLAELRGTTRYRVRKQLEEALNRLRTKFGEE